MKDNQYDESNNVKINTKDVQIYKDTARLTSQKGYLISITYVNYNTPKEAFGPSYIVYLKLYQIDSYYPITSCH